MIPKKIHALWLQGRSGAPDLVRHCLDRWEALNPDHRLQVLSEADIGPLLSECGIARDNIAPQALSDIVRAILLVRDGGIWVDATVLPVRSLSSWLPALAESGFFAFERPGPDRHLSSWFLASAADHVIPQTWLNETRWFWKRERRLVAAVDPRDYGPTGALARLLRRQAGRPGDLIASVRPEFADGSDVYPYFWFHYLFDHMLRTSPDVARAWAEAGKLSADDGHAVQVLFQSRDDPTDAEIVAALGRAPVQKLNWRMEFSPSLFDLARRVPQGS